MLKEAADDELVDAIRAAAAGDTYLNPRLGARLAAEPPEPAGPPDDLSEREVEVLRLIALGHTNMEIGKQLYLACGRSRRTAPTSSRSCVDTSRAELVRYALDHGLLGDRPAPHRNELSGVRKRLCAPSSGR